MLHITGEGREVLRVVGVGKEAGEEVPVGLRLEVHRPVRPQPERDIGLGIGIIAKGLQRSRAAANGLPSWMVGFMHDATSCAV